MAHLSLLTMAMAVLAGCAETQIRRQARDALQEGRYDQALQSLEDGVRRYPDSTVLRSGLLQARAEAQSRLTSQALGLRAEGKLAEARQTLNQALALDPQTPRVQALLNDLEQDARAEQVLEQARGLLQAQPQQLDAAIRLLEQARKDSPRHGGLQEQLRQLHARQRTQQVQSLSTGLAEARPISLDFRDASLRTVLDLVTRHSGINFVLDRDVRAEARVTVLLRQASVEDALDLITSSNQLAKKVVDARTIVIYPNSPEKHREYQEQLVRVFSLVNGDAKGAAAFLKAMLKIRDPFVDERSNMVALRDSHDNIQLAERLIAVYDSVEPEVLLEVEVLEVSSSRLTELGVKIPASFSLTALAPTAGGGLTLGNLETLTRDRVGVGIGNAVVNLRREVGDVSTLANPKLRVRNKEKAKILIGDKIPVIAATTGTGGFVAESVSYLEVGLKLDVEPTIYVDDEVAIRMALEVSTLGTAIKTTSGSLAYQIGTRNATTLLRLRDGETQLLAGLISKDERSTASRAPGLGDLPVLGRLFSSQLDDGKRTELLLAVTPRVLRNVKRLGAAESELWVGTDANPKLRPVGGLQQVGAAPPPAVPTTASPAPNKASESKAGGAEAPIRRLPMTLSWQAPAEAKVGTTFEVPVRVNDAALRGLTAELHFPADKLSLLGVEEGALLRKDGTPTSFSKGEASPGRLNLGILRAQATMAEGSDTVFSLKFKVLAGGPAELKFAALQAVTPDASTAQPKPPAPLIVELK